MNIKYTDASKILKKQKKNPEGFNLTVSEYKDVEQRLDDSMASLDLVRDALSTKSNLVNLKEKVEQTCGKLTVRALVKSFKE